MAHHTFQNTDIVKQCRYLGNRKYEIEEKIQQLRWVTLYDRSMNEKLYDECIALRYLETKLNEKLKNLQEQRKKIVIVIFLRGKPFFPHGTVDPSIVITDLYARLISDLFLPIQF